MAPPLLKVEPKPSMPPCRLNQIDFAKLAPWVLPKLRQKWPTYTDDTFLRWLHAYKSRNEHNAFCTEHALAVASQIADVRTPATYYAELLWVIHRPGYVDDGIACVERLVEWAKHIKCYEFRYTKEGDIPLTVMTERVKPTKTRPVHVITLGGR